MNFGSEVDEDSSEELRQQLERSLHVTNTLPITASIGFLIPGCVKSTTIDFKGKQLQPTVSHVEAWDFDVDEDKPDDVATIYLKLEGGMEKEGSCSRQQLQCTLLPAGLARFCEGINKNQRPCGNKSLRLVNGKVLCWRHKDQA